MLGATHTKIPWYLRIRLWFLKPTYTVDPGFEKYVILKSKWFKGRLYILEEITTPKFSGECIGATIHRNF